MPTLVEELRAEAHDLANRVEAMRAMEAAADALDAAEGALVLAKEVVGAESVNFIDRILTLLRKGKEK